MYSRVSNTNIRALEKEVNSVLKVKASLERLKQGQNEFISVLYNS